jgi:hypothetical protein
MNRETYRRWLDTAKRFCEIKSPVAEDGRELLAIS